MTDTERQSWNDALATLCAAVEQEQEDHKAQTGRYRRSGDLPSWHVPEALDSVSVTEYKSAEGVGWEIHATATDATGTEWRRVFHCAGPLAGRGSGWSEVSDLTL